MDPTGDIREELECGICMELYKEPKTLPCIHSFCRICLARHIISQRALHERTKCFLCPLCRLQVYVPRPQDPLENWANQLPNNTSIPSIISRLENSRKTSCVFHPKETVSSFCKRCNVLACGECLQERHPSCTGDAFSTIREMGLKRKSELLNGITEMESEVRRMSDDVDLVTSVISGISEAAIRTVDQISDQAKLSVESILEAEARILQKIDSAVQEEVSELRRAKNPVDEAADILKQYNSEMDLLLKTSSGLDFMDKLELAKERHKECKERIQKVQSQCSAPTITYIESGVGSPSIGSLVSSSQSPMPFFDKDSFDDHELFAGPPDVVSLGNGVSSGVAGGPASVTKKGSSLLAYLDAVGPAMSARRRSSGISVPSESCSQKM